MTIKTILWFRCRVCNKDFLSYVIGKYICYNNEYHNDGVCFYDNRIGEIHNNHVLNPLKDIRKCKRCNKSNQLEEFI